MRLIDADALKLEIVEEGQRSKRYKIGEFWELNRDEIWKTIDLMPTIEERKTGTWIHGREIAREMIGDAIVSIFYEDWKCSSCGCVVEDGREPLWKFCPSCGADMRGEK